MAKKFTFDDAITTDINEKNNEINKLKEQIEKYRYSRDDKQTLYR